MAIVRLAFKLNDGVNIIDLARSMSITERRLIHQKQVFTVMGGHIADGNLNATDGGDTPIKITTAPNNFYTRNAVTRGFRAWKKSRAKALEAAGDGASQMVAKYADFKVILDETPTASIRLPTDGSGHEITEGEWTYSAITNEAGDPQMNLMIVGKDHTPSKYSLAKGWLETRKNPLSEPQVLDLNSDGVDDHKVDFLNTMFQDTNEDTLRINNISEYNDGQPFAVGTLQTTLLAYSANEPNNLQLQYFCNLKNDDLNVSIPGFQALCGLVRVDVGNDYSDPILILDVDTKGWNF
jgi:hypothetical protein